MNYNKLKKLDEKTLEKLTEGFGPTDECLCTLLSPPENKRGFRKSIKRALASMGHIKLNQRKGNERSKAIGSLKAGKGFTVTKETVKRKSSCGKCGCDNEDIVLKHSVANIRIVTPDLSSICPCPSDCLPGASDKLLNNIKVTVEHVSLPNEGLPARLEKPIRGEQQISDTAGRAFESNIVD